MRQHIFHQFVLINFPDILHGVVTDDTGIQTVSNFLLDTIKGSSADKQNVTGVNGDILLIGVLTATLWRHVHRCSLKQFQQALLHTFSADITGD